MLNEFYDATILPDHSSDEGEVVTTEHHRRKPTSGFGAAPTLKQVELLEQLGLGIPETRGEASKMITDGLAQKNEQEKPQDQNVNQKSNQRQDQAQKGEVANTQNGSSSVRNQRGSSRLLTEFALLIRGCLWIVLLVGVGYQAKWFALDMVIVIGLAWVAVMVVRWVLIVVMEILGGVFRLNRLMSLDLVLVLGLFGLVVTIFELKTWMAVAGAGLLSLLILRTKGQRSSNNFRTPRL